MTTAFVFVLFVVFMIVSLAWAKLRYGAPPPGISERELAVMARAGQHKKALRWYRMRYGVGHGAAKRAMARLVHGSAAGTR